METFPSHDIELKQPETQGEALDNVKTLLADMKQRIEIIEQILDESKVTEAPRESAQHLGSIATGSMPQPADTITTAPDSGMRYTNTQGDVFTNAQDALDSEPENWRRPS